MGKWAESIVKGIEDAPVMALIVNQGSMSSEEVDLANGFRKIILPIRSEEASSKGAFQYHLSNKQWIDALTDHREKKG